MILLSILLLGLFVSFASVFLGLGGGIILVPVLPSLFFLSINEAVATSLMSIFLVVTLNTYNFNKEKIIKWKIVWIMGPISAVFAAVAAQISQIVNPQFILKTLIALLFLVVIRTLMSTFFIKNYNEIKQLNISAKIILFMSGILAGFTSGFAGVGSGLILNPVMILMKAVKPKELTPTANANMMCTTFAAFLSFVFSGFYVKWNQWGLIRWDIALGVFISASFFSYFMRSYQNKLPFAVKSLLLSFLLLGLITKLIIQL